MLRKRVACLSLFLLFAGTVGALADQGDDENSKITRIVGKSNTPCPNAQYTTIADAVNAAAPGDVIAICPALYPEQLIITKPLTLVGITVNNVSRVLIQPTMTDVAGLPFEAVITVMNTSGVVIRNLAVDATSNSVAGCTPKLSVIHYFNSSGEVERNAISGARMANPASCPGIVGNGFGILIDTDGSRPGPFHVRVAQNSIHDASRHSVYAVGSGVVADVDGNAIAGVGPSSGVLEFGVFLSTGAGGHVSNNRINEGTCGGIATPDCINLRSEGVTLRAVAEGTVVDGNLITNAQGGIFINGGTHVQITNNVIGNIDALDGIDIQGTASGSFTDSLIEGNTIYNAVPVANFSCGIAEAPGTGVARNQLVNNVVNDAYCGIAYVTADNVEKGKFFNTLYNTLNTDVYPTPPPPLEP
jgi:hypothetical protein